MQNKLKGTDHNTAEQEKQKILQQLDTDNVVMKGGETLLVPGRDETDEELRLKALAGAKSAVNKHDEQLHKFTGRGPSNSSGATALLSRESALNSPLGCLVPS